MRELVQECFNQLIVDSRLGRKESMAKGSLGSRVGGLTQRTFSYQGRKGLMEKGSEEK